MRFVRMKQGDPTLPPHFALCRFDSVTRLYPDTHVQQKVCISLVIILCFVLSGCKSFLRSPEEALKEDLHSYQKDLLFERYEVAAQRVEKTKRAQYLEALQSMPGLRYAEIEFVSINPCTDLEPEADPDHCAMVRSLMQWYTNASPNIRQTQALERWEYNPEEAAWYLLEQKDVSAKTKD